MPPLPPLLSPADYPDFLHDESRRTGSADCLAIPASLQELKQAMAWAAARKLAVTVQGSRTGIAGGGVPDGGLVVSLRRMDRLLGCRSCGPDRATVRVQAGLTLAALRQWLAMPSEPAGGGWSGEDHEGLAQLRHRRWMFTPDPTETTASLGGMAACNASGACSFAYGAMRAHVEALTLVLADGEVLELRRGRERCQGRRFSVRTTSGRLIEGEAPAYAMPAVKHAAGFWAQDDMDVLDLVIGSEGKLGIIADVELRLMPRPQHTWGIACFVPSETAALNLVKRVRQAPAGQAVLTAVEYFDGDVLALLRLSPGVATGFPPLAPEWGCAVYAEYAADDDRALDGAAEALAARLQLAGGDAGATWAAASEPELARLKTFRHAVPERVNQVIAERRTAHPGLTKVGTDLAVPDERLEDVVALYRDGLQRSGLASVIFGHIGNNHLHVNLLPTDMAGYAQARLLHAAWAEQVVAWGGTVAAEHGIGKLKVPLLQKLYGADGLRQIQRAAAAFDPEGRLNRGALWPVAASRHARGAPVGA